jgi:pimeloyl-ACP methyl ester carboxylesterase
MEKYLNESLEPSILVYSMNEHKDIWYTSSDGLRLYARDYFHQGIGEGVTGENDEPKPTILCMHGLTRNSADFEDICLQLKDRYRLIAVDQRGRGLSQYDPKPENYNPLVYIQDMFLLLESLKLSKVVLLGTSMGGIMAMMMAATKPDLVQALIINDIGPEVAKPGLDRLKLYVGKLHSVRNWQEAAQQSAEINAVAFPQANEDYWMAFARRTYHEGSDGVPRLAYDAKIATPLNDVEDNSAAPDLWPVYDQILETPMLSIRGELSDLLDLACVAEMQRRNPNLEVVEIPLVGHAPMLSEPTALAAVESFLDGLN